MQLKSLGKIKTSLKTINNLLSVGTQGNLALSKSLYGLSTAEKVSVLSRTSLTAQQKKGILATSGVTGEELKNIVSTNALSASQKKATASTLGLGTAFKGLSIKLKELAIAHPILAALTAIGTVAFATYKIYDSFTVSLKEQKEATEEAISAYSDAKSKLESLNTELEQQESLMADLNTKEKLTYVEQNQLEELQAITKELALQQEIEERRAGVASKEAANETVKLYKKQYGDYDISEEKVETLISFDSYGVIENYEYDISGIIAELQRAKEQLNQAETDYNKAIADGVNVDYYTEEWYRYIDMIDDYETALDTSIGDLSDKRVALQEEYNKALEKQTLGENPLTGIEHDVINTYETISDAIKLIYQYTDQNTWNTMEISSIFNTQDIEKTKDELVEMAKAGTLDEKTIESYVNLNSAITDSDLILQGCQTSASAFVNEIYALAEAENKAIESGENLDKTSLSFENLSTSAENASSSVSTLRSSVSDLNDAFEEHSENGSISIDTMLKLVEAGYATALQFDATTGACTINRNAMLDLVQAKIQNQIADLQTLQSDIASKLKEDGDIAEQSANGFIKLAKAKTAAATAEQLSAISDYNEAEAQIKALENSLKSFDKIAAGSYSTAPKKSGSSSAAAKKAETDWKDFLDKQLALYKAELDAGITDFETYLNKSKALLDEYYKAGKIKADEYWSGMKSLYENQKSGYDKVLSAVKRRYDTEISNIQTVIDGIEKQNDALEKQKDNYDKIVSAVVNLLDAEINNWEDTIANVEKENDALDDQKDKYDSILSAIKKLIEEKRNSVQDNIDNLNEENEKIQGQVDEYEAVLRVVEKVYDKEIEALQEQQSAIDEKINSLNDESSAYDLLYRKEQALITLHRAENQRTKKVIMGDKGTTYTADKDAVRDANKTLEDIKTEEIVKQLEDEKKALQDAIDNLNEYKELWSEISNAYQDALDKNIAENILGKDYENTILLNRIGDIESFKDRYVAAQQQMDDNTSMIESYEEKIEYYDSLSEKWDSIATAKENSINKQLAAELLGADWENAILNNRANVFENFKNVYISIQDAVEDNQGLIDSYNQKVEYYQALKDQWNSIATAREIEVNRELAAQMFGASWESEILSGRLATIDSFKNRYIGIQNQIENNQGLVDSYNEKVTYYQGLKEQWASISDAYENSLNDQLAAQVLGSNWETDLLNGRLDVLNNFKNQYISTQQAIANAAWASANEQNAAAKEAQKGASGSGGSAGSVGNSSTTTPKINNPNSKNPTVTTGGMLGGLQHPGTISKYANGGKISDKDNSPLDHIAESIGEDHIVAVRNGERVLTPVENTLWERWNKVSPDIANVSLPKYDPPMYNFTPIQNNTTPVVQHIELTLPNVSNNSGYERIRKELQQMQIDAYQMAHRR